jgi:hypothetical protein
MLPELETGNWDEVFGEGSGGNCDAILPTICPGDTTPKHTFSREDVAEIHGQSEGENDGADWIMWGLLKDGRYFMVAAGCDYTGWDCQAGNWGLVASTREDLIAHCMTDDERERFGLLAPEPASRQQ